MMHNAADYWNLNLIHHKYCTSHAEQLNILSYLITNWALVRCRQRATTILEALTYLLKIKP